MRNSIRKRSTKSRENLMCRKHVNFWLLLTQEHDWLKADWHAEQTLSIRRYWWGPAGGAVVCAIKQGFFLSLICLLDIFVYSLRHFNEFPSLRKNQHKTINLTICKTEFRENICLKITWPDVLLLKCSEWFWRSHSRFRRFAGNKINSAAKELNTTNINWKGQQHIPNRLTTE